MEEDFVVADGPGPGWGAVGEGVRDLAFAAVPEEAVLDVAAPEAGEVGAADGSVQEFGEAGEGGEFVGGEGEGACSVLLHEGVVFFLQGFYT